MKWAIHMRNGITASFVDRWRGKRKQVCSRVYEWLSRMDTMTARCTRAHDKNARKCMEQNILSWLDLCGQTSKYNLALCVLSCFVQYICYIWSCVDGHKHIRMDKRITLLHMHTIQMYEKNVLGHRWLLHWDKGISSCFSYPSHSKSPRNFLYNFWLSLSHSLCSLLWAACVCFTFIISI